MYGKGILKGLSVTWKRFWDTYLDDVAWLLRGKQRYYSEEGVKHRSSKDTRGIFTIQYPEERLITPEEFRYLPFLVYDEQPDGQREILCTSCGICAKVCPPQCIWIVRDSDENGRPIARPAEFYIDAAVCMSCSFCAEFCPFDAIKMNHDFELAVYDRYPQLVYDKAELTVPVEYYAALWPAQYAAEEEKRRQAAEEERRKAEEKARKDAEKAQAESAQQKEQAAAQAQVRKSGDGEEDEAARKARLEELKRKAAERAQQRRQEQENE
jgi:NADH-quinone oxidoreductase subunit I